MTLIRAILLLCAAWPGQAGASQAPAPAPTLGLHAWGARAVEQDADDPLLLEVSLYNAAARRARQRTLEEEAMAAAARASERFKALPPEEQQALLAAPPVDDPVVEIGSPSRPVASLVTFIVEDGRGQAVTVPIRPLGLARAAAPRARLDVALTVLHFGAEAGSWRALPEGRYRIRARLDTRKAAGMWQGLAESDAIEVTLQRRSEAAMAARLDRTAAFHLADRAFPAAEAAARKRLAIDPASVEGTILLGDALAGQQRHAEALEAFQAARALFYETERSGIDEPPLYIDLRIRQLTDVGAGKR
jgi:hypothetical protein